MEKFQQRKQSECMEVEKQTNVSKEKREPTVADLFKIIKLQNEQLQLLQDKVDKFISASQQTTPTISCSTEHVSVTENDQLKMSIGVMTSFEIRTSTIINKEVMTQAVENAQIQCNRSQISIKEVVSKPANLNFLDGITPVNNLQKNMKQQTENGTDKTLNELSLYNVQKPDKSCGHFVHGSSILFPSRVSPLKPKKTHVNGMLHDSEMPSSASAMFRNMRQQCVQMQIDKSNISVTKRVKFGDDPLGIHQPHLYASTDTSLKMNQLAAKYLKTAPPSPPPPPAPLRVVQKSTAPIDIEDKTCNT
ncbi:CBS domain protein [Operophtera brumata]|uniref:CBS domain protein n=1 Tax=Operophtera brumata TaxID=104452 RepID=A0A0L7LGB5_OPEBR|nr:CBS domain protein [Operophtera brumata]